MCPCARRSPSCSRPCPARLRREGMGAGARRGHGRRLPPLSCATTPIPTTLPRRARGSRWCGCAASRPPRAGTPFAPSSPTRRCSPSCDRASSASVFERARAIGTPSAYREFLEDFGGRRIRRARARQPRVPGGATDSGRGPTSSRPSRSDIPTSDFAAEAQRSAEAVGVRDQSGFRSVGLSVEIAPGTPNPERLVRVFSERAMRRYAEAGITLVPLGRGARSARGVAARAPHDPTPGRGDSHGLRGRARHRRRRARDHARHADARGRRDSDLVRRVPLPRRRRRARRRQRAVRRRHPGLLGVVLRARRDLAARAPPCARSAALEKPIASLAVSGSRAIVLFTDGDLEMFDLGDPEQPVLLGAYRRKRDLSRWSGLHLAGRSGRALRSRRDRGAGAARRPLRSGARARSRRGRDDRRRREPGPRDRRRAAAAGSC